MNKSALLMAATAAVLLAAPAQAQTQPAAPPVNHGPPLTGVCILSLDGAIGASTVGKYVQTRLQQITQQVQTELSTEQTALQNEAKALDAQKASLDQGSFDQKNASLQVRANALQRKAQFRGSYQQARCSLLIQRDAVILANPAMDITPSVITGLNAKITQFAFDRERLDQAAPAAPAQPARKP